MTVLNVNWTTCLISWCPSQFSKKPIYLSIRSLLSADCWDTCIVPSLLYCCLRSLSSSCVVLTVQTPDSSIRSKYSFYRPTINGPSVAVYVHIRCWAEMSWYFSDYVRVAGIGFVNTLAPNQSTSKMAHSRCEEVVTSAFISLHWNSCHLMVSQSVGIFIKLIWNDIFLTCRYNIRVKQGFEI